MVTARAVGRLATLAELASPLLRDGGALVAWKGRRDPDEEAELERAGRAAGDGARARSARSATAAGFAESSPPPGAQGRADARRAAAAPGMAKKRPFGAAI